MKNLILTILILNTSLSSHAQDTYKNHQKYWFLRSKLTNDFMKVGLAQGESIPFAQRGLYANINNPVSSFLSGGDLISELGIYIGVLATEYQLLVSNSQNTDIVKHELFCALNAINRLDYSAEPMYGGYSPSTNGFLVRDDIPGDFVEKNYKHFNYYNSWDGLQSSTNVGHLWNKPLDDINYPNTINTDRGFHSSIQRGQCETGSVYYSNFQYKDEHPSEPDLTYGNYAMSQDHVISLMYGLRLVAEYVDWGAIDNNQHFNYGDEAYYSIREEAGVISDRLVKYLKNNHWKIKKPNGYDVSSNEGGDVHAYAYPLAQIAGKINQPNTSINHWVAGQSLVPTIDQSYHNFHSENLGFLEFEVIAKSPGTTFDVITQIAELSSACQCLFDKLGGNLITTITTIIEKIWKWLGTIFGWLSNTVQIITSYTMPIAWENTTISQSIPNAIVLNLNASRLGQRIKYQQDYSLLTNLLLQNKSVGDLALNSFIYLNALNRTKDILNSAPCDGPKNFTYGVVYPNGSTLVTPSYDVLEWSGYSLIEHSNILGSDNIDHVPGSDPDKWSLQSGEYNGLDYMLYHNLYYLYKEKRENIGVNSIDLSNRYINYTIPTSSGAGSQSNPITIGAFEHIIADGHVNSNADVQFLSGKDFNVTYGTNYTIDVGAQVSVNIYRYNCSNNNYLSGNVMRTNNSKSDTSDIYGPIASAEKLHEVAYPPESTKNSSTNKNPKQSLPAQYANKKIINLNDHLEVYPNPNNGSFNVKLEAKSDDEKYTLEVYDMIGKLVVLYENLITINKEISIKNSNLIEGTYLIRVIENKSGKQYSEKIIIK